MRESQDSIRVFNESGLIPGWLVGRWPPHGLSAGLVLRGTFALNPDAPATRLEKQPELSGDVPDPEAPAALRHAMDIVPVKPFVDLLLTGRAYAPGGEPTTVLPVGFELGEFRKSLFVVGEREMTRSLLGGSVQGPHPFTSMPLGWGRSFGGPKVEANPAGRGTEEAYRADGSAFIPLPNLLREAELRQGPESLRQPAGFGPIPADWPLRAEKGRSATYDARWLRNEWPAHPADFDWSFFNAAPPDQQVPIGAVRGDEPFRLLNLHPAVPELTGSLPGLRPRWFFRLAMPEGPRFVEALLNIDTVAIDTEAAQLVLLWRGLLPVRTKSLRDIYDVLIVTEPLDEAPLSLEHYEERLAALKAAADAAPEEAPPPAEIPALEPAVVTMDWEKWEAGLMKDKAAAEALSQKMMELAGTPPAMDAARAALTAEGLPHDILSLPRPQDPAVSAAQMKAAFDQLAKTDPVAARGFGKPLGADELDVDKIIKDAVAEIQAATDEANAPDPEEEEDEPDPEDTPWTRARVEAALAAGLAIHEQDLTGLDLTGLDLSGVDLAGCVMEQAKLAGCTMVGARLEACQLAGADLAGVDLGEARLAYADLTGADLTGARLEGADLTGLNATDARLNDVRFGGARAEQAVFAGADFSGAMLTGARFPGADFTKATWSGATVREAAFPSASAYGLVAPGVDFEKCDLTNFRTGEGADLAGARFQFVTANGSVWGGARLDGADFTDADLREANFSEASLVAAIFIRADAWRARFSEANMEKAIAMKANFFRARFEDTILREADLRGTNCYEAEFLDADTEKARFDLANLKGTKLG